ncbi:MAG TPA: hypothetical protein VJS43_00510, partial [Candidatus Acidoferrales bacterium]|nr:hypothetical protein [Candidatus Acidoferrales bacterium]
MPKSINRHRSLQKGKSRSVSESTGLRQVGQTRFIRVSIPQSEAEWCATVVLISGPDAFQTGFSLRCCSAKLCV